MRTAETRDGLTVLRWVPVIVAVLVALIGYFGPWVPHRAAGLVVPGIDFAEYVKFISEVQSGQIRLLREAFYMPLVAGSLIASFVAGRRGLRRLVRFPAVIAAAVLGLAMLPPAWSPSLLLQPEFRLQMLAIAFCLLAIPLIAVTRFVPDWLLLLITALLALAATVWPAWSFLRVLPPIQGLYRTDALLPGWGFWVATAGWLAAALLALVGLARRPKITRRLP